MTAILFWGKKKDGCFFIKSERNTLVQKKYLTWNLLVEESDPQEMML